MNEMLAVPLFHYPQMETVTSTTTSHLAHRTSQGLQPPRTLSKGFENETVPYLARERVQQEA